MVKTMWKEDIGFHLDRDIGEQYIFIHFLTPVSAIVGGRELHIESGGCIMWDKNSRQRFSSNKCTLVHDWFHAEAGCGELMAKYGIKAGEVYYPQYDREITKIISEIELESVKKEIMYKEVCDAMAEKLFAILARSKANTSSFKIESSQRKAYIKARNKIHSEYTHNWSVEEMARLVNCAESRFYCVYKEIFGVSPQADLRNTRIQRAQLLLATTECSVEKAAELCGFSNQYHFIRQFKKITGLTPGKYKNK